MANAAATAPTDPTKTNQNQNLIQDPSRLNNPQLDEQGKPTVKAVVNATQAWEISKGLKKEAEINRIPMNAKIYAKHGGEAPFDSKLLKRNNEGWRNNFTHFFLSGITDRTEPQFRDAINRVEYLTYSALPDDWPNASEKNKAFRKHITDTIRAESTWSDFVADCIGENTLVGYATPAWLDESHIEWRPKLYRSDQIYFPKGTKQHAKGVPYFVIEEYLLVYEFIERFDQEKAEEAGYNKENCIYIVNKDQIQTEESAIQRVDNIREGAYAYGYGRGNVKTIHLFHLITQEYDGSVELWTVDAREGKEIRHVENLHERMDDATALFSLQRGNGKLYGSKGQGRQLVNIHIAAEKFLCNSIDQATQAGMPILSCDAKDINKLKPRVLSPFIILDSAITVNQQRIEFDAEMSLTIYQKLTEIAENIAGAFIPPQIVQSQTPQSKIADAERAQARQKISQGVLGRNFKQWGETIGVIQRKICHPIVVREALKVFQARKAAETEGLRIISQEVMDAIKKVGAQPKDVTSAYESKLADREAIECVVKMLQDNLTPDEILYLALQPATDAGLLNASDDADSATLAFIQANLAPIQNPRIDWDEATKISAEAMHVPDDRMNRLIKTQEIDQDITAEATYKQNTETGEMMDGTAMPVSGRDNHEIHRQVLGQTMAGLSQAIMHAPTPSLVNTLGLMTDHYTQHVQKDTNLAMNKPQMQQEMEIISNMQKIIKQASADIAQMQGQGINPDNAPVNNGQGPAGMPPHVIEGMTKTAELAVRNKEADLHGQELQLEAAKLQQQQGQHMTQAQIEAAKLQQQQIEHAHEVAHNQEANDQALTQQALDVQKNQIDAAKVSAMQNKPTAQQ